VEDDQLWESATTLLVQFVEDPYGCAAKWGLTAQQILQWANKWSTTPKPDKNFIPKFKLARERQRPNIVVVLNGKHIILLRKRGHTFTMNIILLVFV
jgi:hypothetical protein